MSRRSGKPTVQQIYEEVWLDYVLSEHTNAELESGHRNTRHTREPLGDPDDTFEAGLFAKWDAAGSAATLDFDNKSIPDNTPSLAYTTYGDPTHTKPVVVFAGKDDVMKKLDKWPQHPKYESCAPSDHNLGYRRDDAYASDVLNAPCLPYADTINESVNAFPVQAFMEEFDDELAWAELTCPDALAIKYETIRKARFEHGISMDEIEHANVLLPQDVDYNAHDSIEDVVRDALTAQDLPDHLESFPDQEARLLAEIEPHSKDTSDFLHLGMTLFCRVCDTVACVGGHTNDGQPCQYEGCGLSKCRGGDHDGVDHGRGSKYSRPGGDTAGKDDAVVLDAVHDTYEALRQHHQDRVPCCSLCFVNSSKEEADAVAWRLFLWSAEEEDLLLSFLQRVDPDVCPCDMVPVVDKPCLAIWAQRAKFLEEGQLSCAPSEHPEPAVTTEPIFRDDQEGIRRFIPPTPCSHAGPCTAATHCPCNQAGWHCSQACLCSQQCNRRWRDCGCAQQGRACRNNKDCACSKGDRECEIGVCACTCVVPLDDADPPAKGFAVVPGGQLRCNNVALQLGRVPLITVKIGNHGLGAFAEEYIYTNTFIGEYTGEKILQHSDEWKDFSRQHIGLNYVFATHEAPEKGTVPTTDTILDAARVGSPMRFINHDAKQANVKPIYVYSRGELRIAFYTTKAVRKNAELFLNYGKTYWVNGKPGKSKKVKKRQY